MLIFEVPVQNPCQSPSGTSICESVENEIENDINGRLWQPRIMSSMPSTWAFVSLGIRKDFNSPKFIISSMILSLGRSADRFKFNSKTPTGSNQVIHEKKIESVIITAQIESQMYFFNQKVICMSR